MNWLASLAAIASLLGCLGASPAAYAITGRATPGNPFDDAYHVVSIVDDARTTCTGIALSKSVVLTTAHCAAPGIARQVIAIDSKRINIRVKSSFASPDFDATAMREHRATVDLGLLLLEFPLPLFVYTPMIAPIPNVGDQSVVVGYGADEVGQVALRSASLQVSAAGQLLIGQRFQHAQCRVTRRRPTALGPRSPAGATALDRRPLLPASTPSCAARGPTVRRETATPRPRPAPA